MVIKNGGYPLFFFKLYSWALVIGNLKMLGCQVVSISEGVVTGHHNQIDA